MWDSRGSAGCDGAESQLSVYILAMCLDKDNTLGAVDHSQDDTLHSTFDQMTLIDWQVARAAAQCSSFCTWWAIEKYFVAWKRLGNDESFSKVW